MEISMIAGEDMEKHQEIKDKFLANIVQVEDSEDCWVPKIERIRAWGAHRSMQSIAMALVRGKIDAENKHQKIISLCPCETCCNPDHIYYVHKRSQAREYFLGLLAEAENEEEEWDKLRHQVEVAKGSKAKKLEDLHWKLNSSRYTDEYKDRIRLEIDRLMNKEEYALEQVLYHHLNISLESAMSEAFTQHLMHHGLMTAYAQLPKEYKEAAGVLIELKCKNMIAHFNLILTFLALSCRDSNLRVQLMSRGLWIEWVFEGIQLDTAFMQGLSIGLSSATD